MGYVFYYVEAYLACIFFLSIILFKIAKSVNKDITTVYLGQIVFVTILYFAAEIFWALVDSEIIVSTKPLLYLSNIFTYLLLSVDAYLWFILSETLQKSKMVEKDIARLIISMKGTTDETG